MSEDVNGIELSQQVQPDATIALDESWIAWLRAESIPAAVANADPNIDESGADSRIA
jgi:hypothetical protein